MKNIVQNMDISLARMWDKIKSLPNKNSEVRPVMVRNRSRGRMNSLPTSKLDKEVSLKEYSKDDTSLWNHKYNKKRSIYPNSNLKNAKSMSQLRFFHNDSSLKHARRRIKLANDFDNMLENGFPLLKLNKNQPEKEFTIFISLTPEVAKIQH